MGKFSLKLNSFNLRSNIKVIDPIYYSRFKYLGDRWRRASLMLRRAQEINRKVVCCENFKLFKEIIPLLEIRSPGISFIDKHDNIKTTKISDVVFNKDVVHTKLKWIKHCKFQNKICYQFDGRWKGWLKNPPKEELNVLTSFMPNIEFIRLGNHLSLLQCIEIAITCDCFIGICSGISHIMHSVNIPSFLVQYKMEISNFHSYAKNWTLCNGTEDLIKKVNEFYL